ncbi:hypothetical protein KIPB_008373 [Kipferlia bialata]|uniref:Uncharacterized protein n=1 Tax=Kipferlia bialata TaxID=797122 RepID=A0A391NVH1_9EUKA|nr:hypothetical protein KIPB_008373 [Kipferlia bialata]|eukprot:g8373.t1
MYTMNHLHSFSPAVHTMDKQEETVPTGDVPMERETRASAWEEPAGEVGETESPPTGGEVLTPSVLESQAEAEGEGETVTEAMDVETEVCGGVMSL